jgi:hypothetical protein
MGESQLAHFHIHVIFIGCVRTVSGSDRIRKSGEIHLGPVRGNPFPRGFVFYRGDFSDPVATARGSDTTFQGRDGTRVERIFSRR